MKTFSLSRFSRLFSVPEYSKDYLFISAGDHPYHEEPYRAESYAMAYIKEGGVKLNVGLSYFDIEAPAIICLAPSVIRYFSKRSELLKMDVIFFKDTFLMERYADRFFLSKYDFFENNDLHILPLSADYLVKVNKIYELIKMTICSVNYHENELVRNYVFALIYEIDAYYKQHHQVSSTLSNNHSLFTRFRVLLSKNYIAEHKLDFYAERLNLLPKSLSAAIKKQTGRSASKWISDSIILEAKVLLQNKTLTISQISSMLYFSDQSVFGKFFRSNTGISPVSYRKKFN
jgi:AraC family transcriptional activator of pobA